MSFQCKTLAVPLVMLSIGLPAHALDVTDNFSIGGVLSGAMQCQSLSDDGPIDAGEECQGAMPLQPEFHLRLTENDEFFVKLGSAAGNGLNSNESRNRSPFILFHWAADFEDDVEDIKGRNRDYLFTGWYKPRFDWKIVPWPPPSVSSIPGIIWTKTPMRTMNTPSS